MKCLLCDLENDNDEELKNHYTYLHLIEKNNYYFNELFTQDFESKYSERYVECNNLSFDTFREKKKESLFFIKQSSGSLKPLNISRRGNVITPYPINYSTHKNSYDFFKVKKNNKRFHFCCGLQICSQRQSKNLRVY